MDLKELEKMEELYRSGDWVCIVKTDIEDWFICHDPKFRVSIPDKTYKLIHEKHRDILKAYLINKDIPIFISTGNNTEFMPLKSDFIASYADYLCYSLDKETTQQEINQVIDKQLEEENGTIKLNGGGAFIKEFASKHFEENKTYEITIKEVISIN